MSKTDERIAARIARAAQTAGQMGPEARSAIARMAEVLTGSLAAGGRVYVCGNGGSAADAQHIAGELVGRFRRKDRRPLPCVALSADAAVMTALGNDFGFEQVFSRQVEALGRAGDVLWAISTSGVSPNVVAAAKAAGKLGMKVVAMTGQADGPLAASADVCLRVPAQRSDEVQQLHQLAYHAICELIDEHFASDARKE